MNATVGQQAPPLHTNTRPSPPPHLMHTTPPARLSFLRFRICPISARQRVPKFSSLIVQSVSCKKSHAGCQHDLLPTCRPAGSFASLQVPERGELIERCTCQGTGERAGVVATCARYKTRYKTGGSGKLKMVPLHLRGRIAIQEISGADGRRQPLPWRSASRTRCCAYHCPLTRRT